jgi:hypothetical protein
MFLLSILVVACLVSTSILPRARLVLPNNKIFGCLSNLHYSFANGALYAASFLSLLLLPMLLFLFIAFKVDLLAEFLSDARFFWPLTSCCMNLWFFFVFPSLETPLIIVNQETYIQFLFQVLQM